MEYSIKQRIFARHIRVLVLDGRLRSSKVDFYVILQSWDVNTAKNILADGLRHSSRTGIRNSFEADQEEKQDVQIC